jgi:hypothetical protein
MSADINADAIDACDESFDIADKNTPDDDVDALLLYADVDFTDPAAVEARKAEWQELLGPTGTEPPA